MAAQSNPTAGPDPVPDPVTLPVDPPQAAPPQWVAPQPPRPAFRSAPVGWAVAAMLVFWPTGIPALLATNRASHAFGAQDVEVAQRESANAKRWGVISVIVGASLFVLSILAWVAWLAFVLVAVHHLDDGGGWHSGSTWSHDQPFDGSGRQPLPQQPDRNGSGG